MNDQEAYDFYADPANLVISGPGHRRKRPNLTSMASVRFAPEVIGEVKNIASAEGITTGAWIRRLVDGVLRDRRRMAWLDEHRHELEVVPGSGRLVTPHALMSMLTLSSSAGRTLACQHMSIGGIISASCGQCGPMRAAA